MTALDESLTALALGRVGASLRGRYGLERLIGIGGTGAVYAGKHRNGHAVAIKILHSRLSSDPQMDRLFRREALIANTIDHPGVVPVIDDDLTEDGSTFLVMPLLHGETLRSRVERLGRRLPADEAIPIAHAILGVLDAAHARRIVHRDIKPENVFITRDGEVRVLDFGIARFSDATDAASAPRSGRAVGTAAFMAPEQARGHSCDIDERSDLWAVGALLFSLLSGRSVHEAESAIETLVLAATTRARSVAEVARTLPGPVVAVIDRALAFEKCARWSDARTMRTALVQAHAEAFGRPFTALSTPVPPADSEPDVHSLPTDAIEVTSSDFSRLARGRIVKDAAE